LCQPRGPPPPGHPRTQRCPALSCQGGWTARPPPCRQGRPRRPKWRSESLPEHLPTKINGATPSPTPGTNGPPTAPPPASSCGSSPDLPIPAVGASPTVAASSWLSMRQPPLFSGALGKKGRGGNACNSRDGVVARGESIRVGSQWQFCCNFQQRQGQIGTRIGGAEGKPRFLAPWAAKGSSHRDFSGDSELNLFSPALWHGLKKNSSGPEAESLPNGP
jgi:hypothetical protein